MGAEYPVFLKTTLWLWVAFLGASALASAGYDYRPGLEIKAPLIRPTNPELR